MGTPGQILSNRLKNAYTYTPATLESKSNSTAPYNPTFTPRLNRLPAFIVHCPTLISRLLDSLAVIFTSDISNNSVKLQGLNAVCANHVEKTTQVGACFQRRKIMKEGDVTRMANNIVDHLEDVLWAGYQSALHSDEQPSLIDQRPDRFLVKNGSRLLVWEDESHQAFHVHAPSIIALADSEGGRRLTFRGKEEHGRAMLYKLAVSMFDIGAYWSLLFGGNRALVFQRVASSDPTRYGIVCSDILHIDHLFVVALAILLVPRNLSLVDLAPFAIPLPTTCPPCDNQILTRANVRQLENISKHDLEGVEEEETEISVIQRSPVSSIIIHAICLANAKQHLNLRFVLPGYEPAKIFVRAFTPSQGSLTTLLASPPLYSPPDPPPLIAPPHEVTEISASPLDCLNEQNGPHIYSFLTRKVPTLNAFETPFIGATGLVFKVTSGQLELVVKAIPPGWNGRDDLYNEVLVYQALAALEGTAIPRSLGCFEGEGWVILVMQDCGNSVTEVSSLSSRQRELLWQHACSIHASGVAHHDLEPRNLLVSSSGESRMLRAH
ncbi:hypothetical protein C8R44DRAFT_437057 [Mycena epipterygia]|nr:hypothetical protein C8R44DRAFT_437057 [Mycena epipterygia]